MSNIYRFNKNRNRFNKKNTSRYKRRIPIFTIFFCLIVAASIIFPYREMKKANSTDKHFVSPYGSSSQLLVTGKTIHYDLNEAPPVKDNIWVLYQRLSDTDKRIYDMFLDLVDNRYKKGYNCAIVISDQSLQRLEENHFWNIYHTMCYDHPEYFFLLSGTTKIHCSYISSAGQTTYIYNMESSETVEHEQIMAFENATESFMQNIDLSAPDQEIELQIHDNLIDLVSYNDELYEQRNVINNITDLGYTAYGALVQDSNGNTNYAVCQGYSLAYEHLLHKAGIPCIIVSGKAYTEASDYSEQNGHAWNVVQIDSKWYEVDPTWDDFEFPSDKDYPDPIIEAYEEARFNICHHYYNKSTEEFENLPATDETMLYPQGYEPFNIRQSSSHKRFSALSNDLDDVGVYVNSLIPIAE